MFESERQEQIKKLRSTLLVLENQIFAATHQLLELEKSLYEDELKKIRVNSSGTKRVTIIEAS